MPLGREYYSAIKKMILGRKSINFGVIILNEITQNMKKKDTRQIFLFVEYKNQKKTNKEQQKIIKTLKNILVIRENGGGEEREKEQEISTQVFMEGE